MTRSLRLNWTVEVPECSCLTSKSSDLMERNKTRTRHLTSRKQNVRKLQAYLKLR